MERKSPHQFLTDLVLFESTCCCLKSAIQKVKYLLCSSNGCSGSVQTAKIIHGYSPLLNKVGLVCMFRKDNVPSTIARHYSGISRVLEHVASGNQVHDVPGRSLSNYLWADHILRCN